MKIEILETLNAAFCEEETGEPTEQTIAAECARIVRDIADKMDAGQTSGPCVDANGNKVGRWTI